VSAAEAKITPGAALEPSTSRFKIGAKYEGGDWWIWAGTQWIGYVPASAWGGHFTKGTRELNYGEVFDNEEHLTSAMGNGQFGSSASATFMTQSLVTLVKGEEETTGYHGEATNSSLYSIGDINSGKTEWHFGGPGDLTLPSTTTEPATEVREEQTTLNGKVNPNGFSTNYYFQYGENHKLWLAYCGRQRRIGI
jgi:Neprosin